MVCGQTVRYGVGRNKSHIGKCLGFRLAPLDLTLDDRVGPKKVILSDMKYAKNYKSYNIGPNRDYIDYRVHMGFTLGDLERLDVKVTIL